MIVGQRINTLLGFDFLSVHYTEVAVAILLKMIFCVLMSCIDVTEFSRQKHWTAKRSFLSPFIVYAACA